MDATQVAAWLRTHPDFFNDHPDLLETLRIPYPTGERVVSLVERQVVAFREKNRLLEQKLEELLQFGEENDRTSERLHGFLLDLFSTHSLAECLEALPALMKKHFEIEHSVLKLYALDAHGLSADDKQAIEALEMPVCTPTLPIFMAGWLGSPNPLSSFAYLPLMTANQTRIGVYLFGSSTRDRFYADMGTLYLSRLGELLGTFIHRTLEMESMDVMELSEAEMLPFEGS